MENIEIVQIQATDDKTNEFIIHSLDELFTEHSIPLAIKPHRVAFFIIIFITSGSGKYEIDFKEYSIQAGDVIFLARDRVEKFIHFEELNGIHLKFTEEFLYHTLGNYAFEVLDLFQNTFVFPVLSLLNRIILTQIDLLKEMFLTNSNMEIKTSSFRTLVLLLREQCADVNKLNQLNNPVFIKYALLVDQHLHEYKSVEEYSKIMNVSKKTINHMTRISLNLSAKNYIIERIMQKAKISLCFEDKSIDEIAYGLGFSEPSNFSRFFKKNAGLSPLAFRHTHGNSNNRKLPS